MRGGGFSASLWLKINFKYGKMYQDRISEGILWEKATEILFGKSDNCSVPPEDFTAGSYQWPYTIPSCRDFHLMKTRLNSKVISGKLDEKPFSLVLSVAVVANLLF